MFADYTRTSGSFDVDLRVAPMYMGTLKEELDAALSAIPSIKDVVEVGDDDFGCGATPDAPCFTLQAESRKRDDDDLRQFKSSLVIVVTVRSTRVDITVLMTVAFQTKVARSSQQVFDLTAVAVRQTIREVLRNSEIPMFGALSRLTVRTRPDMFNARTGEARREYLEKVETPQETLALDALEIFNLYYGERLIAQQAKRAGYDERPRMIGPRGNRGPQNIVDIARRI